MDLIAWPLLNNQEILSLIVQVLVGMVHISFPIKHNFFTGTYVLKSSYVVVYQTEWPEAEGFFMVYASQNKSNELFNPTVVTIRSEITQVLMLEIIEYCTY